VQYDFLPTPEEMSDAHHALVVVGQENISSRDVLTEARKRGRPRGTQSAHG
jgi:phosphoribosyl-ATP pyrophosphohydrolase